ncbi:uncharacterized protein LOC115630783 [Scaptodrosophila lebanonensis]|uniref:Uncharacterized protein LOC115630783 n=1 Tax=Drosophila lebanonensis TaxID=7225 RepID=A0A6J2U4L6_DROLE|nr:uncharacterized protein LOC115630783 [Scaptodrosophila lebanonensis]
MSSQSDKKFELPSVPSEDEEPQNDVTPSSSQSLDKRLNPDAPEFVPGLAATLLANKLFDELSETMAPYTKWSNAANEDVSYGPRYDAIWRESGTLSRTAQLNASAEPFVPLAPDFIESPSNEERVSAGNEQLTVIDGEPLQKTQQLLQMKGTRVSAKQSGLRLFTKRRPPLEDDSSAGFLCPCVLM